jgi:hypothetical protein
VAVSVAQPGVNSLWILCEGEELYRPLDLALEVPFDRTLGLRLGDEEQEGVRRVIDAYISELDVHGPAPVNEGRHLDRAPSQLHQLVCNTHLLHELEGAGVYHQRPAPIRADRRLVDDPASDAPRRELGRHGQPRRTGPDDEHVDHCCFGSHCSSFRLYSTSRSVREASSSKTRL